MDPLFEIGLELAGKGSRESTLRLYQQLKAAIVDGRLATGARLPSTRKSEAFLGVSRNTAVEVYERLSNEGYVVTRRGSGTYVADRIPAQAAHVAPSNAGTPDRRLNAFWLSQDMTAAMGFWRDRSTPASSSTPSIDFRPALVDSRLFPFDVFRQVMSRQLRGSEKKPASFRSPQGNQGNFHLREAIVRHIALTRAVACQPDDILVTSGAQQAFDLLARVLVTPGQTVVALEDPGYPPMRAAFAAAGARLVPIGVDDEGLIVDQLPADVGVICVCPSHQFPIGATMSVRRRRALVEFARSHMAVIIEDDYDGEFRYHGSPLEALRTADAADAVVYVGTFSKCMLPALRLGFVVAPDWMRQTLVAAKNCMDWHCSIPIQAAVAGFIADGHLTRHVRRMRGIYASRREMLLRLLQSQLAEWLDPIPSFYGMHAAATTRVPLDLDVVTESLLQRGVRVHSFARYYLGAPTRQGLVFGYGAVDILEINHGVGLLREVLTGDC